MYEYIGKFGDIDEKTVKRFGITATQIQIDTWPLLYNNVLYGFSSLEEHIIQHL